MNNLDMQKIKDMTFEIIKLRTKFINQLLR